MTDHMLRAAQFIARKGLAVFPCLPGAKKPATRNGLQAATTDLDLIGHWWRQCPEFNIAVATGAVSNIIAIDVDGIDAEGALRTLEAANTPLPPTVETITARGRHLLFKYPPQRDVRNSASKIAPDIDVRGSGGYIMVPPSLHPSGKRYSWSVDSASHFAALPPWLLDRITTDAGGARAVPPTDWVELIHDGAAEGSRNDSICRVAGHLLRKHVDPEVVLELALAFNAARCRPPLSAQEVLTITNSVAVREAKRRGLS